MNGDMTSDQQSQTAQRQLCPYCGRPFKRLKTHLPHCKMAPIAKEPGSCTTRCADGQSATTAPERLPEPNLPKDPRLSPKAEPPKVRTDNKARPKKSEKSSVCTGSPTVMDAARGKAGMEALHPHRKSPPGDERSLPRPTARGKDVSDRAADDPRSTQTKAKREVKVAKSRMKQTQDCLPGSSRPSVVEAERGAGPPQMEPHTQTRASGVLGSEGPSRTRFCVGDDVEGTRATKTWGHSVTADPGGGALKAKPAVLSIKPLDSSVLATETTLLHKPRPLPAVANMYVGPLPRVTPIPACTQTPPLNPFRAPAVPQWGPGERWSRPAGLEWMPDLALAFRGIGFSMLPQRPSHTEHVQKLSPQIQPVAAEIQGCLTKRALMDVRLAELPSWLMSQPLPTLRTGVASLQRGWSWYYSRYIDVRRGGVSGVAMLLTSYCVLSYIWSYPRLKEERWRKYH